MNVFDFNKMWVLPHCEKQNFSHLFKDRQKDEGRLIIQELVAFESNFENNKYTLDRC